MKEFELQTTLRALLFSLTETKRNQEHWSIVHKYAGLALYQVEQYGWTSFYIPPSDLEEGEELDLNKLKIRAAHYYHQCATKLIMLENCIKSLETDIATTRQSLVELKTKTAQDHHRFQLVWLSPSRFSLGNQTTLFTPTND